MAFCIVYAYFIFMFNRPNTQYIFYTYILCQFNKPKTENDKKQKSDITLLGY